MKSNTKLKSSFALEAFTNKFTESPKPLVVFKTGENYGDGTTSMLRQKHFDVIKFYEIVSESVEKDLA